MTPTPHDALFRAIFSQPCYAAEELRTVVPREVLAELDLAALRPREGSFIDEGLRASSADLLFSVGLKRGGTGFVYVLFEHQSTLDPRMPWRLLQYQARIWERHLAEQPNESTLPPILALMLHQGPRPWPAPPRFVTMLAVHERLRAALERRHLDFEFLLDDLATQTDAQILGRASDAVVRLTLLALRNGRAHPRLFEHVAGVMQELENELRGPAVVSALARLARYVLEVGDASPAVIRSAFAAALSPRIRSSVMSTADMLRAEGHLEARRESLLDQLEIKFGPVDAPTRSRIEHATNEQLVAWLRRVVVASALAAVFAD